MGEPSWITGEAGSMASIGSKTAGRSWYSTSIKFRASSAMSVYSSVPSGSGPFPAVVIAHPISGVAEFTQSIADRLAEAGYAAVAMDLFHRVTDEMTADGTAKCFPQRSGNHR